jgi:hypothetical protein
MKMVKQTSYAQELELLKHQDISANSFLKTPHQLTDQEGTPKWEDDYNNLHFLIKP